MNEQKNSGSHDQNGRLHLDHKTGHLTINDIRPADFGIYKVKIKNGRNKISKTFLVHDSSEREDASENSLLKNGQISESSPL
ncbi:hypothetical protein R3I94_017812 [Phoxinus phoxinus]